MSVKTRILAELAAARGQTLSGQALAERLGVSRAAVWKAITALRSDGAPISAATNHGYTLAETADVLSAEAVTGQLGTLPLQIEVFDELPGTNAALRTRAAAGAPEGLVLAAAAQTEGRGRSGRVFHSPGGSGVYFSILLRPTQISPQRAPMLTAMAAVAAAEAAEDVYAAATGHPLPEPVRIKWVNDLLLGGKKICGILTEAALDLESGCMDYAVLGVGFNLTTPPSGWPQSLQNMAGSLFGAAAPACPNLRAALVAGFLRRFFPLYQRFDTDDFLPGYRARQAVTGHTVEVLRPGAETRTAQALSIDEDCRLVVRYLDTGETAALQGGEVRVLAPALQKDLGAGL